MEEEFKKDEAFWDDKNSKVPMIIIVALILALGVGTYILLTKYLNTEPSQNNIGTKSDDSTISDDATISDDVTTNGEKLYIYAKGFAENGPIAFTYDCVSEECSILTTEKGLILYDEDKVQYRELTKYEYDQIYNSDSPAGEKLDKDGFKEIVPTRIFELDEYETNDTNKKTHNLYKIEKENYFLTKDTEEQNIYNFKDYCEYYKDKCLFDNQLIAYNEQLYDLKTDTFIHELKEHNIYKLDIKQNFVIVEFKDSFTYYSILNEKNKEVLNTYENGINSYYLKNEDLYYIKDNKVLIEDAKGVKKDFDNTNITSLAISGSMLLYLDNDNQMNIKDLNTNNDVYNSEIKTTVDLFMSFTKNEEKYSIVYADYDALKTDEWYNSVDKDVMVDDFDVNSVKQCTNENYKDNSNCTQYVIGYKINLDKDGKYLSKESYFAETGI